MFSSSGYFRGVTCPYFASGLCERPHCHFRHVKADDGLALRARVSMPESVLRQSVAIPLDTTPGHRGLPVTVTMPSTSRKPALLSMVGEAIKQVQKDIEQDKASFGYGTTTVQHPSANQPKNVTYNPTPIPRINTPSTVPSSHAPAYVPTTKGTPSYNPTPIKVLQGDRQKKTRHRNIEYSPSGPTRRKHGSHSDRVTLGSAGKGVKRPSAEENGHGPKRGKTEESSVEDAGIPEAVFSDEESDSTLTTPDQRKDVAATSDPQNNSTGGIHKSSPTAKETVAGTGAMDVSKLSDHMTALDEDDDVIVIPGPAPSKISVIVLDDDENESSDKPSKAHDGKTKHSGKDSEKENKSKSSRRSSADGKDSHRHRTSDSRKSKSHSSDKGRHSHRDSKHSHSRSSSSKSRDSHSDSNRGSSSHSKRSHSSSSHSSKSHHHSKHKSSSKDKEGRSSKGSRKPELKKSVSHVELFGDDSDEEKPIIKKEKLENGDIDSDDVISLSSSTFEDAEFIREARESLDDDEVDMLPVPDSLLMPPGSNNAFDEFLDFFDEEGGVITPRFAADNAGEEPLFAPSKRVAHNPVKESLMHKTATAGKRKKKLTPSQVMLERYKALQMQAAAEGSSDVGKKTMPVSEGPSTSKRVAHAAKDNPPAPNHGLGLLNKRKGAVAKPLNTSKPEADKASTPCGSPFMAKRTAHTPKQPELKRPMVQPEPGSKIPTNIRQRYLNLFIDECLKIYPTQQDAFDRAIPEEKAVQGRSGSKKIYLNLCINAIRKLRMEGDQNKSESNVSNNPKGLSHQAMLGGAKAASTNFTVGRCGSLTKPEEIKGVVLYNHLSSYILTPDQLKANGFPVPDQDIEGTVSLKVPDYVKRPGKDPLTKMCSRCGKFFQVNTKGIYLKDEDCNYHWGKAFKRRVAGSIQSRFTCCDTEAGTPGCQIAKKHVHEWNKYENLTGYVSTTSKGANSSDNKAVYALDCEMVYTTVGQELARVTVVDAEGNIELEEIVKPLHEVVDYNTRFSGMKESDMEGVTIQIGDIQDMMLDMFSDKTILMGHSLESDLIALKLVHPTVVDTSVVYPHRMGPPYKRALRHLCGEYLQRIIQDDVGGHDSAEDARSALDLMLLKVKQDAKKKYRTS